jgi:hypothetical protein
MVASKKVPLQYNLDPTSKLASFIEWYENTYRTINEDSGRNRKGDAKKAIKNFLESAVGATQTKEYNHFVESVKQFTEDTKLPKELQRAKNTLSTEEYENFKTYYQKIQKEEEKYKSI